MWVLVIVVGAPCRDHAAGMERREVIILNNRQRRVEHLGWSF